MKNLSVLILFFLFHFTGYAQRPLTDTVLVGYHYWTIKNPGPTGASKDTSRTFSILSNDVDKSLAQLSEKIGSPTISGNYQFVWNNVKIEGIDHTFTLQLSDGITTKQNGLFKNVPFRSLADKNEKLKKIGKNSGRDTELTFLGEDGKNIVRDKTTTQLIQRFLQNTLF